MKVHDEIETLTDVYLAGGLEAGERQEIEEHAASCDACAAVLRDAKEFHGWVSGSSAPGAPPTGLEDRIIANLRAATPGARRWPRAPRLIKFLGGIAALFIFIVIGGLFTGSNDGTGLLQRMTFASHGSSLESSLADEHDRWKSVEQSRGPGAGEIMAGYKNELQRNITALNSLGIGQDDLAVAGGGGAGYRGPQGGRAGDRKSGKDAALKNYAEGKTLSGSPAPATPAPMEEPMLADHNESLEKFAGEMDSADKAPALKPGDPEPPVRDDRKIIRNADLHLEVEKYEDAYKAIGEISRAKKGFISGASTTKLANGKIRATVILRIPPEKFEEALADLGKLGNVRHQAITTADVTKQYLDLESRLKSKETLVERLKKVLLEGRGTVKELMEVEVQMGATIEQIEAIKGELKYYNDLVGMSTITMQVSEKDLGLPFEYVQTMQATIGVTDPDADAVYANAQKAILDAGGQVAESRMTRANDDSASGYVRGKVDAEKFPALRETLKRLAKHVDQDTVNQQQTGRGGQGDAKPGAPVRKEQAVVDFTVNTPPIVSTRQAAITIEAAPAGSAYQDARKEVEAAGGKILAGSLTDKTGGATAFVRAQVDAEKFPALVEKFKALGKVKNATVKQDEPGAESGRPPLYREKGDIVLEILTPAPLLTEEQGFGRVVRETFAKSIAGVLWSIEKLFVGIALAGPWIVLAILVILLWRRARRPKTA
jgi:glycine cleavage system regulatory protein